MINQGFSNGEIARALKVSDESVRKYRSGSNKNVQNRDVKKGRGSTESIKHGGGNQPSINDRDQDPGGKPGDQNTVDISSGESTPSEGSTGDPGSKRGITFVGGKKSMSKKEGSEAKEEDEYQCYNCDHVQGSPFTECPKCGASNNFEE